MTDASQKLLHHRLDVHDRRKFELKLEYQPSGRDKRAEYRVEMFMFLPASLNVDADNYPRQFFYWDIHNYVRLKTPVLEVDEILALEVSPLIRLAKLAQAGIRSEKEIVYVAKLVSCVFRGALRRFAARVEERCREAANDSGAALRSLEEDIDATRAGGRAVLDRFRELAERISASPAVAERTRASLRLVDEYLSLTVEQFFRKAVSEMERLPRTGGFVDIRKDLMSEVIREEDHRRDRGLKSVLNPDGDNEQYMHRVGFLKKFCQNSLFLRVRRAPSRKGLEEVMFATAAGVAMAFATAIAFLAQLRFTQVSFNFFVILVVGYMMKDRIKEGMRRIFSAFAAQYLFDRTTVITDPETHERLGVCKEKVDYVSDGEIPDEVRALRQSDDFITVSRGELAEVMIRYQKQIVLDAAELPRTPAGSAGVTDIIRLNVQRLLRDMDEPEYAIEYIDLEDLRVGRVRGAKSYQVDVAFRFSFDDADAQGGLTEVFRLVLDRNGIKRLVKLEANPASPAPRLPRSAA